MLDTNTEKQLIEAGVTDHSFDGLWALLPKEINTNANTYLNCLAMTISSDRELSLWYFAGCTPTFSHKSPTTAVAMLLLWAIREGHVEIK